MNAALLRLIPVREPGQLVWFDSGSHGRALSYPFYEHVRKDARFDGILCAFPAVVNISSEGMAERAEAELVSGDYFEVLGITPAAGRLLTPSDDRAPVAVVSYDEIGEHLEVEFVGQIDLDASRSEEDHNAFAVSS